MHLHPKLIVSLVLLKFREFHPLKELLESHLHPRLVVSHPHRELLELLLLPKLVVSHPHKDLPELLLHPRLVAFLARQELLLLVEFLTQAVQAEYQVCLYRIGAMAYSIMVFKAMVDLCMDHQLMLTRRMLLLHMVFMDMVDLSMDHQPTLI